MPFDLSRYLVVGVSSRALFDLANEDKIFHDEGLPAYAKYQIDHEDVVLAPGCAFPLVKALLALNDLVPGKRKVEVVIMSRNNGDTSLRIWNSIKAHKLDISRSALTGGAPLAPYLGAYNV